jgi:release factor glutamine methyltransferase
MPESLKTVRELIQVTTDYLASKGIDSPRLNAERLLAEVLSLTRMDLYLQHDRPVTGPELDRYRELVRRRAAGEPLQTLLGETEFYSRAFKVEPGVFIPRPETEILIERCLEILIPPDRRPLSPVALEIGCGCGVIGVTLAAEIPTLQVFATDINPAAVRLTEYNARRQGVRGRMTILEGKLFAPLPVRLRGQVDLLVSNPPYVRRQDIPGLPVEVSQHDPVAALDGGQDGLKFYRALAANLDQWLKPGGWIVVEIGADAALDVHEILARAGGGDIAVKEDYNRRPRVVSACYGGAERSAQDLEAES